MSRLPVQPGERIARERVVRFTFDGHPVEGYEGDTIGSALYAAGRRTFSRSFKYHRRRGLMCCAGQCPNCIVAVDGAPGARACTEPVTEGMRVEHLNATPGLEFDLMSAVDRFGGALTPPGFYYKTFIRPRKLWPVYEKVLRHAAGLGRIAKSTPIDSGRPSTGAGTRTCWSSAAGWQVCVLLRRLPSWGPTCCLWTTGRDRGTRHRRRPPRNGGAPSRQGCRGRGRDPRWSHRAWVFRRARAGVAGQHAAPDPRPTACLRDGGGRAAARVLR